MSEDRDKKKSTSSTGSIVVFAGKNVGRELVRYLSAESYPLQEVYISSDENVLADDLIDKGIAVSYFDDTTVSKFVAAGKTYAWLLNLWAPLIFPRQMLEMFDHRLNVHPGLVPHCRGSDCAAWGIRTNSPAGVSLLEISDKVDGAAVYSQISVEKGFPIRGWELQTRLETAAINLFRDKWERIWVGQLTCVEQVGSGSYFRRRDTENDRKRDGKECMSIEETFTWVQAHDFGERSKAKVQINGIWYRIDVTLEVECKKEN